jgi:hypothetical protein
VKKISAVFILLFFSLSLWAQEETPPDTYSPEELTREEEEQPPPPKKKFSVKNRIFELSLVNLDLSLSNSFFAASDIIRDPVNMIQSGKFFKDSVSINFNDFFKGFTFLFNAFLEPVSLNFNRKDKWGVGLDIGHINVAGNLLLSGNLLSLNEADNDKFGLGAAVFADVGIPIFFHYDEIKIKIRPSAFLTLVYTEPNITYSYRQSGDPNGISGMRLQLDYDIRVYSAVNMKGFVNNDMDAVWQDLQDNAWDIAKNNLGYDFSLGVEYPWFDFLDIGVDIINIPLVMANLNHYLQLEGEVYFDSSKIDIAGMINGEDFPKDAYGYPEEINFKPHDDGSTKIYRPFKMLFYAKWRPFESSPGFSLIPSLGFSINSLYTQLASIEGGLSASWDVSNMFITTIGINYYDRRWKNNLDFVFNLRAFELDLGISFQSPDFVKSFQGAGLGVVFGLKFGW